MRELVSGMRKVMCEEKLCYSTSLKGCQVFNKRSYTGKYLLIYYRDPVSGIGQC